MNKEFCFTRFENSFNTGIIQRANDAVARTTMLKEEKVSLPSIPPPGFRREYFFRFLSCKDIFYLIYISPDLIFIHSISFILALSIQDVGADNIIQHILRNKLFAARYLFKDGLEEIARCLNILNYENKELASEFF